MGRKHAAMTILGMSRDPVSHVHRQANDCIPVHCETIGSIACADTDDPSKLCASNSSSPLTGSVRSRYSWMKLPVLRRSASSNGAFPFEIDVDNNSQVSALLHYPERDTDQECGINDMNIMDLNQDNNNNKSNNNNPNPSKAAIYKARVQILVAAILYGTSFPLTKILDDHAIPLGPSLALRFGLATLVTLPWLWEQPALDWKTTSRPALIQGMGVGVWVAIGFLAQAIGIVTTQANKVGQTKRNMNAKSILLCIWKTILTNEMIFCAFYHVLTQTHNPTHRRHSFALSTSLSFPSLTVSLEFR